MLQSFAGGTMFGEVWGSLPPRVLALHGWRRTHADFVGVVGPSSPTDALDALALDLPGFGATPPPPEPWGSSSYADAVAGVLEEVGIASGTSPVVVLGHSFGGRVALALAAEHPGMVAGLVLTGTPLGPADGRQVRPPLGFRIARHMNRAGILGDTRMEKARRRYGSADYAAAQGVMRQVLVNVLAEKYARWLSSLSCPVELVWGSDDTEAPVEVARRMMALVPTGPSLTVCEGAGHMTPFTAPEDLRAAVGRLLEGRT